MLCAPEPKSEGLIVSVLRVMSRAPAWTLCSMRIIAHDCRDSHPMAVPAWQGVLRASSFW